MSNRSAKLGRERMPGCDKEVEVVYDNDGPIIDKPVRPIRVSRIETQWNG